MFDFRIINKELKTPWLKWLGQKHWIMYHEDYFNNFGMYTKEDYNESMNYHLRKG